MSPKPDCKRPRCNSVRAPQRAQRTAKASATEKNQETSGLQAAAITAPATASNVSSIGACSIAVDEVREAPFVLPIEAPKAENGEGYGVDAEVPVRSASSNGRNKLQPSANEKLTTQGPSRADGTEDGERTEGERLDAMPLGRKCKRCGRVVFVEGAHCPKPCGGWLLENDGAVRSGKYSVVALRKDREAILERWRAKYRGADGHVKADVDSILRQLAKLEAVSDRCVRWSEATKDPVTSIKHEKVIQQIQGCADRIARLHVVLESIAPASSDPGPRSVTFGGRYREPGAIPSLRIVHDSPAASRTLPAASEDDPETPQDAATMAPVVEAEVLPAAAAAAVPVREEGTLAAWNGALGVVLPAAGGKALLAKAEHIDNPAALRVGASVSFERDGGRAVAVREVSQGASVGMARIARFL